MALVPNGNLDSLSIRRPDGSKSRTPMHPQGIADDGPHDALRPPGLFQLPGAVEITIWGAPSPGL